VVVVVVVVVVLMEVNVCTRGSKRKKRSSKTSIMKERNYARK
jgi:uncharacterized membrane protein